MWNPHAGPLRVGIIGTGGIAHAHAAALSTQENVELAVAVDLDPGRSEEFAAKWSMQRTAPDLRTAAASGELDLVVICTPPASHMGLALDALGMDLHVVIEKPPALSLEQMNKLIKAEAASRGSVSCVFQHRFGSGAQRVLALHEAGWLGRPLVGTCNTLWFRNQAYFDVPWRGLWDVEGGGPTMGHGIHQFDLLVHLFGPWQEVTALASRLARKTDTEDVSAGVVRFESGAIATIMNSVVSPRETSQLRLDFEHATLELEHLYGYDNDHWRLTPAPGSEELAELWAAAENNIPSGHSAQYSVILDRLKSGEVPPVSLAGAYPTMELAAAIYASSITGKTIRTGEINEGHPFFTRMDGHLEPWKQQAPEVSGEVTGKESATV
jgi:predicted dehydrogenase